MQSSEQNGLSEHATRTGRTGSVALSGWAPLSRLSVEVRGLGGRGLSFTKNSGQRCNRSTHTSRQRSRCQFPVNSAAALEAGTVEHRELAPPVRGMRGLAVICRRGYPHCGCAICSVMSGFPRFRGTAHVAHRCVRCACARSAGVFPFMGNARWCGQKLSPCDKLHPRPCITPIG